MLMESLEDDAAKNAEGGVVGRQIIRSCTHSHSSIPAQKCTSLSPTENSGRRLQLQVILSEIKRNIAHLLDRSIIVLMPADHTYQASLKLVTPLADGPMAKYWLIIGFW